MYEEPTQSDAQLFDRLVDGELATDERQRLLASIDGRPDGWRKCALAFLEAQAWRTDLGQAARETNAPPVVHATASDTAVVSRPRQHKTLQWLAIAAALLIAFGLGALRPADFDGSTTAEIGAAPPNQFVEDVPEPLPVSPPDRAARDALVFFVNDGAGGTQRIRVPLVDAGTLDRQLGVQFRSGVPEAIRSHLEQYGFDVHSQRRYAPLHLENGGALVLPVEDTRIVPVSPVVF